MMELETILTDELKLHMVSHEDYLLKVKKIKLNLLEVRKCLAEDLLFGS